MSRSNVCRQDIKEAYAEMFKKKEMELAKLDPEVAAKLKEQGVEVEQFKPLDIDAVADEIDKLRNKISDPMKFRAEANRLLADMQAERVNKKIDFYIKQMYDMSLKNEIIADTPQQTLKNLKDFMDIRLDNRINHLSSKNIATLGQLFTKKEKDILSKNDPNITKQIYNAIEGYDLDNIDDSIKEIAKKISKFYDYLHQQQVDAGFRLGYLSNFTGKRTYDPAKIRANREQAIADLMDSIDVDKTFPHLDLRLDQDKIEYEKIVTRIIDDRIESDLTVGSKDLGKLDSSMRSSLEARQTRERKLKFKAGKEGEWAVKYGKNTLLEQLAGSARTVAKVSANRELFGVNPRATVDSVLNAARRKFADDQKFKRATEQAAIDKLWSPYNGTLERLGPSSYSVAADTVKYVVDAIKTGVYMAKLGKTTLSAIVDIPNAAAILDAATGQGLFKSYGEVLQQAISDAPTAWKSYITGNVPDDVRMRAAELGVFIEAGMGEAMRRAGIDGNGSRAFVKLQEISERINPIGKQTAFHDLTAMMVYQNAIAKMLKNDVVNEEIFKSIKRVGISDKYVAMMKKMTENVKGTEGKNAILFSPSKLDELTDAEIKGFKDAIGQTDPRVAMMSMKEFRHDSKLKMQNFFDDFRNFAIPKPSGATKRIVSKGQSGTILGETINSLFMLKSFSIKMLEVQNRIYNSSSAKNKQITRMAAFAISMTGMGYVALTLDDLTNNRTPRPFDNPETYKDAFLKGGAGGIYADLFMSAADGNYNNFTKGLTGPMAQPVEDVLSLTKKAFKTPFVKKKKDGLTKKDLKTLGRNLPFQNHLIIKPVLNHLFLDAWAKSLDPQGYKRNIRSMKNRGQKPLFR